MLCLEIMNCTGTRTMERSHDTIWECRSGTLWHRMNCPSEFGGWLLMPVEKMLVTNWNELKTIQSFIPFPLLADFNARAMDLCRVAVVVHKLQNYAVVYHQGFNLDRDNECITKFEGNGSYQVNGRVPTRWRNVRIVFIITLLCA